MESNHYLSIIRKSDFTDLFKYGYFNIYHAIEFDGKELSAHSDDDNLFDKLTVNMNMFEYSFEYLIIHFTVCDSADEVISINVKDVQEVYTFNAEAKKEMSISFDPRIQLYISPWAEKFEKLQQKLQIKQNLRGIDNLWSIFGLSEDEKKQCEQFITKETIDEVFREQYTNERPSGEQSLWVYLLRYERHSFYPRDMKGFFCDFIHVVCNWMKKKEQIGDVAESTTLYSQLINTSKTQFDDLSYIVSNSPLRKIVNESTECNFAIAAPLFLFLKDKFKDGFWNRLDGKFINHIKKNGLEGSLAIYLLGLTLGYDKTYDAFYDSANLSFLKKKPNSRQNIERIHPSKLNEGKEDICVATFPNDENPITQSHSEFEGEAKTETDTANPHQDNKEILMKETQQTEIEFENVNSVVSLPLAWMRKGSGKNLDVRPAFDDNAKNELLSKRYTEVKKFTPDVKSKISQLWKYNPEHEAARFKKQKRK